MLKHHLHHIGKAGYLMRAYEQHLGADRSEFEHAFGRSDGVLFNTNGRYASIDWPRMNALHRGMSWDAIIACTTTRVDQGYE